MEETRYEDGYRRRRYKSPASGILLGGIIAVIGLLLLLDNMDIIRFHDVWQFWPVLLVVFGLIRIIEHPSPAGYIWGGTLTVIGILLLLANLHILYFDFDIGSMIWPFLLIAFGLSMLWKSIERTRYAETGGAIPDPKVSLFAFFGGGKRRIVSQDFKGGDVVAVFGGYQVDLRQASIAPGGQAVLDVTAIFGGVDVRVPETWDVNIKVLPLFGGCDDKCMPPKLDPNMKSPTLVITGVTIFGGASVKN